VALDLRVAVVGAGGLGGPIALGLAAAGVEVVVCDDDVVDLSNLHRQVQFRGADLGQPKAPALAARIVAGGGRARPVVGRFAAATAAAMVGDCALIVDGSDDAATKFAVADWARATGRRYAIAAALQYGGNVFCGGPGAACYRCLFEEAPPDAPSCGDAGVLGPVVGWVGGVAAERVLRLAAGEAGVAGSVWVVDDARRGGARVVTLARREDCVCAG